MAESITQTVADYVPRILIIDDEQRIRDACTMVLEEQGYQVSSAEDGIQGLRLIEKEHFDIILLDLMMPTLSGFDVLARVKTIDPDAVVIVITGYSTLEHSIEAMKKGAFDFIPKPFSPDQLRVVTAKAIDYTRALTDIATEQSRMRVLINRLSDGVLATDTHQVAVLCNPAFQRLVGYTGQAARGSPVDEIIASEPLRALIDRALAMAPDEFVELTCELRPTSSQELAWPILAARCFPFRDRAGSTLGTITVLQDITAQKRMDQLKSDFVSLVAHEIRSPMSSVLMQIDAVRGGLAGEVNEKQLQILDRTSMRIQSLVDLSSELLDLSKIESGLIAQERELLDVAEIVGDQLDVCRPLAEKKRIALTFQKEGDLPRVVFNRQNLQEVLQNLITNGIKYTPEEGAVTVRARTEGDELCLQVIDTGFGISDEDQAQIFRKFYRVKNEKTRYITGTGLGLPIVQQILEAHNARIQVESQVGRGSTFSVFLPQTSPLMESRKEVL